MAFIDNRPHDFTVIARRVVEDTVGHKIEAAALHRKERRPPEGSFASTTLRVIESIVSRNSIRSTVRLTCIPQNHVKAIVDRVSHACAQHRRTWSRGLICGDLRCKATLLLQEKNREPWRDKSRLLIAGSAWAWTCIDLKSAFVPLWLVGPHNPEIVRILLEEAGVLGASTIQMDAENRTVCALHRPLSPQIPPGSGEPTSTKQPGEILRIAHPWLTTISDGLARKVKRHAAALELLFAVHNLATANAAGVSPAMAAGVADHVWTIAEIVDLAQ